MWHRKLYHVFLEHYHDTQNTYVVQTMSVDEVQQGAHRQFMTFSDNKTVLMAEICCKPQCSTSKCISQWEVHYGSSLGPTDGRKSSSVHRWVLLHTVNTHSHWQFIISCQYSQSCLLAIWRPLVPHGHSYKASTPDWVKPSFEIFDSQALWRSALIIECPDVKNYKWLPNLVLHRMLYRSTHGNSGHQMARIIHSSMLSLIRHPYHNSLLNTLSLTAESHCTMYDY